MKALPREFYLRDAQTVAKELLGKTLTHRLEDSAPALEITETEAYLGPKDPACHSFGDRRTPRTEVLYRPGGYAYLYLIYGMHYMLNAVTGEKDDPCAVLIRAGLPIRDFDTLAENRFGKGYHELTKSQKMNLCDGPGKLAKALKLTREQNGLDFCGSPLLICEGTRKSVRFSTGPRVGIDYAGEAAGWPLNFKMIP